MKNTLLLLFSFMFMSISSQETGVELNNRFNYTEGLNSSGSGAWAMSVADNKIIGTSYLFDNWNNNSIIVNEKGIKTSINNLNFDTKQRRFVVKISLDSVYIFNPIAIKQVKLNNKIFKRYFINNNYDYYELIAFTKGKEILKNSFKLIKKGKRDPFTNLFKQDEYVLKIKYFCNSNSGLEEIKLKQKYFKVFFGDDYKKVKKFISKNKLSLKNDLDLEKIFNYYKKI